MFDNKELKEELERSKQIIEKLSEKLNHERVNSTQKNYAYDIFNDCYHQCQKYPEAKVLLRCSIENGVFKVVPWKVFNGSKETVRT